MKVSAAVVLLAVVAASPEVKYFRYERPIEGTDGRLGQRCLLIDPAIFSKAAPMLADLRLYRDGVETPYAISTAEASESVEKPIAPLNVGVRSGETVFDANLPEGQYSDIELSLDAKDFIAAVTVVGSQTSGGQGTKLGTYTVFDLTGQKLGRSTVLHLPASDFSHLQFSIKGPISPESVRGLTVVRLSKIQPKYVTAAESTRIEQKGYTSLVVFDVPAHVPVDRIVFKPGGTPSQFSRRVTVSAKETGQPPPDSSAEPQVRTVAEGNLLRVHTVRDGQRIDEEHLELDVPWLDTEQASTWTVSIENGDDLPLQLESVQLQMLERNLCFDANGAGKYVLYYGDPALSAPVYDYAALFSRNGDPKAEASALTAGQEEANPAYQPRPDERPFTEKHPALLWIALVGVIALLGGIALRSAKAVAPKQE
jgi:hypothetical protein